VGFYGKPGYFLDLDGEDGVICERDDSTHDAELNGTPKSVNEPRTWERLDIVKDDGNASLRTPECLKNAQEPERKTARGPSERGVLDEKPRAGWQGLGL